MSAPPTAGAMRAAKKLNAFGMLHRWKDSTGKLFEVAHAIDSETGAPALESALEKLAKWADLYRCELNIARSESGPLASDIREAEAALAAARKGAGS